MKKISSTLLGFLVLFVCGIGCKKEMKPGEFPSLENGNASAKQKQAPAPATKTLLYKGLTNPRGLKFGPDGALYVAEAGPGGTQLTVNICPLIQVEPPFGPFKGSPTGGGVSRVDMAGNRSVITNQLPSSQNAMVPASILGPSDVAFMGETLYVLMAGAGCSHGVSTLPNSILRINADHSATVIANLSEWILKNPTSAPADDFEPEGVWYSMVTKGDKFYTVEPNQGLFVEVGLNGSIKEIVDISAKKGHIVPTALTYKGNYYVGNLGTFPIEGKSVVLKITPSGNIQEVASGFSTILGLAIDQQSRIYVLEMTSGAMFPSPGRGRIIRINQNGSTEEITAGLSFPTAMTMGPDGNLYVSNFGFGGPPGAGEIVKVTLNN